MSVQSIIQQILTGSNSPTGLGTNPPTSLGPSPTQYLQVPNPGSAGYFPSGQSILGGNVLPQALSLIGGNFNSGPGGASAPDPTSQALLSQIMAALTGGAQGGGGGATPAPNPAAGGNGWTFSQGWGGYNPLGLS